MFISGYIDALNVKIWLKESFYVIHTYEMINEKYKKVLIIIFNCYKYFSKKLN